MRLRRPCRHRACPDPATVPSKRSPGHCRRGGRPTRDGRCISCGTVTVNPAWPRDPEAHEVKALGAPCGPMTSLPPFTSTTFLRGDSAVLARKRPVGPGPDRYLIGPADLDLLEIADLVIARNGGPASSPRHGRSRRVAAEAANRDDGDGLAHDCLPSRCLNATILQWRPGQLQEQRTSPRAAAADRALGAARNRRRLRSP